MPFAAPTLYRELKGRFGAENIFFDGVALQPGMDWLREIKLNLTGAAGAFLALIGPAWLDTVTAHEQAGTKDYVVQEIELGLQNRWTFIPVLLNDAPLPDLTSLQPSIQAFWGRQAAHLRMTSWDNDIEDLTVRLDEIGAHPPVIAVGTTSATTPGSGPPDETGGTESRDQEILSVDDEHYQTLIDEADNLVIFLGARANVDAQERPLPSGSTMPPDDTGLADYLAAKARIKSGERELAEVAQYARMCRGESRVFDWVNEALSIDLDPGPAHSYLARLPQRLEELGIERRHQMIVTPKLDLALEKALREAGEPFDVAVYMGPRTKHAGLFVHIPWMKRTPRHPDAERLPRVPHKRYERRAHADGGRQDQRRGQRLTRYPWGNNYVITEDHYIDFARRPRGRGRSAHADPREAAPGELHVPRLRHRRLAAPGIPALDLAGHNPATRRAGRSNPIPAPSNNGPGVGRGWTCTGAA